MSFLNNLNWRYATKKFDSSKKISEEDLAKIREAIRFTPTSLGLEMYKVLEVIDPILREKVREVSFDQTQITEADRVFIFLARNDAENRIEEMFSNMSGGDNEVRAQRLKGYEDMVKGSVLTRSKEDLLDWSARQAYIVLGFALAACAELQIDSCPMEGFQSDKLKEVLGLSDEFSPVLLLPVGYRDENDDYIKNPKWRFPESLIIEKR